MKKSMKWPWLSIGLGFAATFIGVTLTAMNAKSSAPDSGVYLILGGVLAAFGPVVLSYEVSKRVGRREVRDELLGHLESISMNLGHSVAALDTALKRNGAGVDDAHVTLSVVHSLTSGIEVQIGQLQKLIGEPFSAEALLATRKELVNLAGTLTKAAEENDPKAVLEASRGIEKAVRKLVKPTAELEDQLVSCPSCTHQFSQRVGILAGSTSKAQCPMCTSNFNLHRDGQGSLFVRMTSAAALAQKPAVRTVAPPAPVASPETRTLSVQESPRSMKVILHCPKCENSVKFWSTSARDQQVVVCLECDTGIAVDSSGVLVGQSQYSRESVPIVRTARTGFVVLCPSCGNERNCKIRLDNAFFGYCADDSLTLTVTPEAVDDYRELAPAEIG